MVLYQCYRCNYTVSNKSNMVRHIARKKRCNNVLSDIELDECKKDILDGISFDEYLENNNSKKENLKKVNKKSIKSQHLVNKKSTFSQHLVNKKSTFSQHFLKKREKKEKLNKFECIFCNKILSYKQSLHTHYKSCKEKIKSEEVNDSMKELINIMNEQIKDCKKELSKQNKELEKRDKQIDELIKKAGITNNINIQNNYKLLSYNDTDISHLSDKDIRNCLEHNNLCIPHLVKKVHFNPKKPENHNIYISNIKNNYAMKYDGGQWNLENQDEAIEILIDDKQLILEQKLEEWIETGKEYPDIMAKFNRYLEKKEKDDVLNTIKEEIKLILFNNREIIKKS